MPSVEMWLNFFHCDAGSRDSLMEVKRNTPPLKIIVDDGSHSSLLDCRSDRVERRREQLAELNRRITETEARLNRLYDAIEAGLADLNDESLKERMTSLKAIRDHAKAEADRLQMTLDSSGNQTITVDMLDSLSSAARADR